MPEVIAESAAGDGVPIKHSLSQPGERGSALLWGGQHHWGWSSTLPCCLCWKGLLAGVQGAVSGWGKGAGGAEQSLAGGCCCFGASRPVRSQPW